MGQKDDKQKPRKYNGMVGGPDVKKKQKKKTKQNKTNKNKKKTL